MSSNFLNDENKGDIIIYQSESGETKIDVRFQDETVWLTQADSFILKLPMQMWLSTSKTSIPKVSWTKVQPVGNSDKFAAREIAMWSAKDYIITWT